MFDLIMIDLLNTPQGYKARERLLISKPDE
jgi:hypothetical protein